MNRCSLFAKLTKSSDINCGLFEELLDVFFEEYNILYGAMNNSGVIDDIVDLTCLEDNTPIFKVEATFDNVVTIDDDLIRKLEVFLKNKLSRTHNVKIDKITSDSILITLIKKG